MLLASGTSHRTPGGGWQLFPVFALLGVPLTGRLPGPGPGAGVMEDDPPGIPGHPASDVAQVVPWAWPSSSV